MCILWDREARPCQRQARVERDPLIPQREDRPMFHLIFQVEAIYVGWAYQFVNVIHHGLRALGY